jgi:hypothetical protein
MWPILCCGAGGWCVCFVFIGREASNYVCYIRYFVAAYVLTPSTTKQNGPCFHIAAKKYEELASFLKKHMNKNSCSHIKHNTKYCDIYTHCSEDLLDFS